MARVAKGDDFEMVFLRIAKMVVIALGLFAAMLALQGFGAGNSASANCVADSPTGCDFAAKKIAAVLPAHSLSSGRAGVRSVVCGPALVAFAVSRNVRFAFLRSSERAGAFSEKCAPLGAVVVFGDRQFIAWLAAEREAVWPRLASVELRDWLNGVACAASFCVHRCNCSINGTQY